MKKNKKPVILITGYLGSGKTTLLNNLLKQEKRKVALIVNDMGSINVDAEILKKNGSNVTECPMFELQNGCICCTLRDEFIQQIEKISNLSSVEVVFVEASGISDPGAVSASFLAYEEDNPNTNVYLTSIVTVVDADRIYREFLSDLKQRKEAKDSLAEKYDLPDVITDFIRTHHGKGIAKFFYVQYKNKHPEEDVDIEQFTYPGPNPQTREQAIIMMTDTVEAATKSLPVYSDETISKKVDELIDNQVKAGYFEECPITFRDIAIAKIVLAEKLKSIYHTRITYPKLNNEEQEAEQTTQPKE